MLKSIFYKKGEPTTLKTTKNDESTDAITTSYIQTSKITSDSTPVSQTNIPTITTQISTELNTEITSKLTTSNYETDNNGNGLNILEIVFISIGSVAGASISGVLIYFCLRPSSKVVRPLTDSFPMKNTV